MKILKLWILKKKLILEFWIFYIQIAIFLLFQLFDYWAVHSFQDYGPAMFSSATGLDKSFMFIRNTRTEWSPQNDKDQ
jgi:hypothetical protein